MPLISWVGSLTGNTRPNQSQHLIIALLCSIKARASAVALLSILVRAHLDLPECQLTILGGYTRGPRVDYDEWAELVGDERWSYENQLPYMKKAED